MAPSVAAAGLLLLLLLAMVLTNEAKDQTLKTLRRRKRNWIIPPPRLMENVDYTQKPYIAKIRSDKDKQTKVEYYLTGPGANKPPVNLFVVDHDTGFVRITDVVDRERYPFFNLTGVAKYTDGTLAEFDVPLTVTILDMNDNAPYFELHSGSISEGSAEGTFVMQIEGRDDDQPGTVNSQISYSIISQEPEGIGHMFRLDERTGKLYLKESTLDRETVDFYRLVVQGVDLGGAPGGMKGSGTVEIRILDINDNIPTPEHSGYSCSVDENTHDVVVTRIRAVDLDLEHTDNWRAVFVIAKGNEDHLFTIETDEDTNEGVLKLAKPLDFEEVQKLELALLIQNVAPFAKGEAVLLDVGVKVGEGGALAPTGGSAGGASAEVGLHLEGAATVGGPGVDLSATHSFPIWIDVNNVPEDPAFIPIVKEITVSEDLQKQPEDGIIAVFAAVDPDTGKPAEHVRYAKAFDPDNWFTIDPETAEIKLNKDPDRESPFVVNGNYMAKIVAISKDDPSATATGTINIKVADYNDHCPTLVSTHSSLCADRKSVYVSAVDEDVSPNAAPFTFTIIPEGSQSSWDIEVINDTTAALHAQENLWPGLYKLQVMVSDAQGLSCPVDEVFTLHVCTCVNSEVCHAGAARRATSYSELSAAAIGLLLLGVALLLLVPLLLLFCQCGGANTIFPDQFTDLPFGTKQHLISYHTEGKGEDEEVPLRSIPVLLPTERGESSPNINGVDLKIIETTKTSTFHNESLESKFQETREVISSVRRLPSKLLRHGSTRAALFEHVALPDAFLEDYYTQRAEWTLPGRDELLGFSLEGQGSSAGSLSCSSLLDDQDDLQFLNDLGVKFKTLAEICSPPGSPPPPPPPAATLTQHVVDAASASKHVDLEGLLQREAAGRAETSVSSSITSRDVRVKPPGADSSTISSSSDQAAALLPPPQTLLLQQQPVYFASSTILQPVQYVVQPHLQNLVLLADKAPRAEYPGLVLVQGSRNPPLLPSFQASSSGIIARTSKSHVGGSSPAVVLGPGVAQASGWRILGPNPDRKTSFVGAPAAKKTSPGIADPGLSYGSLKQDASRLLRRSAAFSSLTTAASPTDEGSDPPKKTSPSHLRTDGRRQRPAGGVSAQ